MVSDARDHRQLPWILEVPLGRRGERLYFLEGLRGHLSLYLQRDKGLRKVDRGEDDLGRKVLAVAF